MDRAAGLPETAIRLKPKIAVHRLQREVWKNLLIEDLPRFEYDISSTFLNGLEVHRCH